MFFWVSCDNISVFLLLYLSSLFLESKFLVVLEMEGVAGWLRGIEFGCLKSCIIKRGSPWNSCIFIPGDSWSDWEDPLRGSPTLCLPVWASGVLWLLISIPSSRHAFREENDAAVELLCPSPFYPFLFHCVHLFPFLLLSLSQLPVWRYLVSHFPPLLWWCSLKPAPLAQGISHLRPVGEAALLDV